MLPISTKPLEEKDHRSLNHVYLLTGYISALVLVIVLTHFSRYSLIQERFVLTMGFLGLAIVYWISCYVSNRDNPLRLSFSRPTLEATTPIFLVAMILAGMAEPLPQPVVLVEKIGYDSFIRAAVMIGASVILPGLLLLSLIGSNIRPILRFVIAVHLSLAIIALFSFVFYYTNADMELMRPSIVIAIAFLWSLRLLLNRNKPETQQLGFRSLRSFRITAPLQLTINKWHICLALMVVASIAIGFTFHTSQRYMIPGDSWRVLQPGADLLAGRDISETTLAVLEYPLTYGFLMAGLSAIAGIPILNVNMFLFPFVALNLLSFYALVRNVLGIGAGVATTAALFYAFTGGLGWLMGQVLQLKLDFWTLSYTTQDMLFSYYFLDNIQFWHRTLAMTFGFAAITTFYVALQADGRRKWVYLSFASLFMIFSYFIHMLPLIFVVPAIAYLWYARGKHSWLVMTAFIACTLGIAAISDTLLSGYYSSLTVGKISKEFLPSIPLSFDSLYNLGKIREEFIPSIPLSFDSLYNLDTEMTAASDTLLDFYDDIATKISKEFLPSIPLSFGSSYYLDTGIAASIGLGTGLFMVFSRNKKSKEIPESAKPSGEANKVVSSSFARFADKILRFSHPVLFGLVIPGIYIYGIFLWSTFPSPGGLLYEIDRIPWYYLPIRFGLVGLLAISALFFIRKRERWTGLFLTWFSAVFLVGNIWWGPKILSFLFPLVAFLAAIAMFSLRRNATRLSTLLGLEGMSLSVAKVAGVTGLSVLIVLSTSSYIYGLSQYVGTSSKDNKVFEVVSWIYMNIPKDERVAVYTDEYSLEVGVSSLSAHDTLVAKDLKRVLTNQDRNALNDLGIKYFVGKENEMPRLIRDDLFPVYSNEDLVVLLYEPTPAISAIKFANQGSGTSDTGKAGYSSFNKNWQITWEEQLGMVFELDRVVPKGSKFSFVLGLNQSQWDSASSVQRIQVNLDSGDGTIQTVDLLDDLKKGAVQQFVITVENDVKEIKFLAVNGGTNNASIVISDVKYLDPEGEAVRMVGS